ncbi:hypothetical protein [Deinococcus sp.]|uniref:hypothetical protein n=1 Tax=Deinococcus sp. TaxID=47478 RepID=UPI0028699914|nr:hypothetical protein [Deinococcus sp.]
MFRIAEAAARPIAETGQEPPRLAAQGVPGVVIPPDFEESFYRHGNLPEQLRRLFAGVNPARIDEDALEPLAARAQALIRTTYLLDDAVQAFYRALAPAGLDVGESHARRPGTLATETAQVTPPGTAALHAVKRLWVQDWAFDAVLERLDDSGSVALEARPTLLIPGPPGWPDAERAAVLGVPVALVSPLGLVGLP